MVFAELRTNEYIRSRCAEWVPDIKSEIDMHFYVWATSNADEISAVKRIGAQKDEAILDQLASVAANGVQSAISGAGLTEPDDRRAFCIRQAKSKSADSGTIRQRTPNASRFLLNYLSSHQLSASEYRNRELVTGCTKQGLNMGSDFDVISAYCECFIGVLVGGMTDEEFDDYYGTIKDGRSQDANKLPQFVAVVPQLEQCQSNDIF